MLYTKENPKGIDHNIQSIQIKMYDKLREIWELDVSGSDWNCYGRCYRNQDENGKYIPEVYSGEQGVEYIDPLYNDTIKCTSFFGVSNRSTMQVGGQTKTLVHLIFSLNVQEIKNLTHRGDEEIHNDVLTVLKGIVGFVDQITDIVQWMDAVFQEYDGYKSQKGVQYTDMHPKHCFRINFYTEYKNSNC